MNNSNAKQDIKLLDAPLDNNRVLYFDTLDVHIVPKNCCAQTVVIHELAPKFQGISDKIPEPALSIHKLCNGLELNPGEHKVAMVPVTPSLVFLQDTNYFDVTVTYSFKKNPRIRKTAKFPFKDFILIRPVPIVDGTQAFISFKDPQDLRLAELTETLLRRAGINPYLARNDSRIGDQLWPDKIIPAIQSSKITIALWTRKTLIDPRKVKREIIISQEEQKRVALFLQKGVEPPKEYPQELIEHAPFTPLRPHCDFAKHIESIAKRLRGEQQL